MVNMVTSKGGRMVIRGLISLRQSRRGRGDKIKLFELRWVATRASPTYPCFLCDIPTLPCRRASTCVISIVNITPFFTPQTLPKSVTEVSCTLPNLYTKSSYCQKVLQEICQTKKKSHPRPKSWLPQSRARSAAAAVLRTLTSLSLSRRRKSGN